MVKTGLNIPSSTLKQEKAGYWSMTLQLYQMVVQQMTFSQRWMEQHDSMGRSRSLNEGRDYL